VLLCIGEVKDIVVDNQYTDYVVYSHIHIVLYMISATPENNDKSTICIVVKDEAGCIMKSLILATTSLFLGQI